MCTPYIAVEVASAAARSLFEPDGPKIVSKRAHVVKGVLFETAKALSLQTSSTSSVVSKCDAMWQSSSAKAVRFGMPSVTAPYMEAAKSSTIFSVCRRWMLCSSEQQGHNQLPPSLYRRRLLSFGNERWPMRMDEYIRQRERVRGVPHRTQPQQPTTRWDDLLMGGGASVAVAAFIRVAAETTGAMFSRAVVGVRTMAGSGFGRRGRCEGSW